MAVEKMCGFIGPHFISYLGPSSADFREDLSDDEDLYIKDDVGNDNLRASLFPLRAPTPLLGAIGQASKLPPPTAIGEDDLTKLLECAELLFECRDYDKACSYLERITAWLPEYTPALLLRGQCHHARGNFVQAMENYNVVLALGSLGEADAARLLLADCLLSMDGREHEALIHLARAIEASPSSDAYALRGRALLSLGDCYGAERDLQLARNLAKNETQPVTALAEALSKRAS